MSNLKICTKCKESKDRLTEFYMCSGSLRGECKICTIRKNKMHQKKTKSWRFRMVDAAANKSYRIEYYRKNKDKFATYRANFKAKYPDYYKEYSRKRKEK